MTKKFMLTGVAAVVFSLGAASDDASFVAFTTTDSAPAAPRLDVQALQHEHSATAEASLQELRQHGRVLKRTLDRGLAALRRDAITPETSLKIAKAGRDYERSYDRTLSRCAYAGSHCTRGTGGNASGWFNRRNERSGRPSVGGAPGPSGPGRGAGSTQQRPGYAGDGINRISRNESEAMTPAALIANCGWFFWPLLAVSVVVSWHGCSWLLGGQAPTRRRLEQLATIAKVRSVCWGRLTVWPTLWPTAPNPPQSVHIWRSRYRVRSLVRVSRLSVGF